MKISVVWDITPCTPLKKQGASLLPPSAGYLLGLLFDPEDGGGHVSPKRWLTFHGPHDVTSKKIEIFQNIVLFDINETRRIQILQRCQPGIGAVYIMFQFCFYH
jgi:hypothetical protein